jgi:hypothetical protein
MKLFTKLLAVFGPVIAFTLGSTLAAWAEDAKVPEGKLAIHYYRADGKYDGWGLHVWESFQKKEEVDNPEAKKNATDRTLPGVGWTSPLRPAGTDDFGVYWLIPASEFDNGKVNYIIHRGDGKEQGGKDMSWLIKNGKEIWVNGGDSNIYMGKDDALKARK